MQYKKDMNDNIMDEKYWNKRFYEKLGSTDIVLPNAKNTINKYSNILPNELLTYWEKNGFSSFHNGLFWLTNPDVYHDLLHDYFSQTPLADRKDLFVIARSAFGKLFIWQKNKGYIADINIVSHLISFYAKEDRNILSYNEEEYELSCFLGTTSPKLLDRKDASRKPLFERALKKLGKLKENEMYGYKLIPALGGKENINNLDKIDLFVYADIQLQMVAPSFSIIDTENQSVSY